MLLRYRGIFWGEVCVRLANCIMNMNRCIVWEDRSGLIDKIRIKNSSSIMWKYRLWLRIGLNPVRIKNWDKMCIKNRWLDFIVNLIIINCWESWSLSPISIIITMIGCCVGVINVFILFLMLGSGRIVKI